MRSVVARPEARVAALTAAGRSTAGWGGGRLAGGAGARWLQRGKLECAGGSRGWLLCGWLQCGWLQCG